MAAWTSRAVTKQTSGEFAHSASFGLVLVATSSASEVGPERGSSRPDRSASLASSASRHATRILSGHGPARPRRHGSLGVVSALSVPRRGSQPRPRGAAVREPGSGLAQRPYRAVAADLQLLPTVGLGGTGRLAESRSVVRAFCLIRPHRVSVTRSLLCRRRGDIQMRSAIKTIPTHSMVCSDLCHIVPGSCRNCNTKLVIGLSVCVDAKTARRVVQGDRVGDPCVSYHDYQRPRAGGRAGTR